jgi:hypothetical protein
VPENAEMATMRALVDSHENTVRFLHLQLEGGNNQRNEIHGRYEN